MKQILYFAIAALFASGLASCSNEGDAPDVPGGKTDGAVAICLGSKVKTNLNVITRADGVSNEGPIDNTTGSITFGIAGWERLQTGEYNATPTEMETYDQGALWATTASCAVHDTEKKSVIWTEQKYYNADENKKTFMKAWYPAGTINEDKSSVSFENTTGKIDALWATPIYADKWDKNDKNLNFAHKTAQIKFKVQKGEGLEAGTKLKSITLQDVNVPVGFDLKAVTESEVKYSNVVNLKVPDYTEGSTTITDYATSPSPFIGSPVMIKPITNKKFKVTVETDKAIFRDMEVTVNTDNIQAGTAYTILLTFKQEEIVLTATVAQWTNQDGNGEII